MGTWDIKKGNQYEHVSYGEIFIPAFLEAEANATQENGICNFYNVLGG